MKLKSKIAAIAAAVAIATGSAVVQAETLDLNNALICGQTTAGRCTVYQDEFEQIVLYWSVDGHVTVTDYDAATGTTIDVYATNLFRDPRLGLSNEVLTGTTGNITLSGNLTTYRYLIRSGHSYYVDRTKFTDGLLVR